MSKQSRRVLLKDKQVLEEVSAERVWDDAAQMSNSNIIVGSKRSRRPAANPLEGQLRYSNG